MIFHGEELSEFGFVRLMDFLDLLLVQSFLGIIENFGNLKSNKSSNLTNPNSEIIYPLLANKNLPSLSKNIWYLSVPTEMFK
jgi:hypothetical protein